MGILHGEGGEIVQVFSLGLLYAEHSALMMA